MKRIFYTVVLLICWGHMLPSCSDGARAETFAFPETISLQGEERTITDSVHLRYAFRARLQGDTLYVMDLHPSGFYVHRFDYRTMQHLGSLAPRGPAPSEFLSAETIRLGAQGDLWVLDANKSKLVRAGEPGGKHQLQIDLDKELIRTLDFDRLNDSVFIVPDYTGLHRITLLNSRGKILRHAFQIPGISPSTAVAGNTVVLAQAWRPFISYNAHNGILGLATQLGQVVEIYDVERDSVIKIIGNKHSAPQFQNKGGYAVPTGIMGYSDIHVGKEYIYALFWGSSFEDIKKQGQQHRDGGKYIHVFDLHGMPVRQYRLDRAVTGFHIDESNKRIIALDVNSDQPIVQYTWERKTS